MQKDLGGLYKKPEEPKFEKKKTDNRMRFLEK